MPDKNFPTDFSELTAIDLNTPLIGDDGSVNGLIPIGNVLALAPPQAQTPYVAGINLTAVAQTALYTVPAGKRFIVDSVEILIDSITGAAVMPTVKFGITGDTASIKTAVVLDPTMNVANAREQWTAAQLVNTVLAAGSILEFGVAVGGTSTTHVGTAIVRGLLVDA